MGDPKPYSRVQTRKQLRAWVKAQRVPIAALIAAGVVLILLVDFLLGRDGATSRWPVVAFLLGAGLVGLCWAVHLSYLVNHPGGVRHLRGAWGEEFTRDALKRARLLRLHWGVVNGLALERGDIDHIVVSREGGLVAIDSKFRSMALTPGDRDQMVAGGRRHRDHLATLTRTVVPRGRGRHKGVEAIAVTSVVALWGPASHQLGDPVEVDGVHLMKGADLVRWMKQLEGEPISKSLGRELTDKIREWAERQRKEAAARASAPAGS